jgi:glycyl-tRNA synthetase beta chain
LVEQTRANYASGATAVEGWESAVFEFLGDREEHLLERRGHALDAIRAVKRFAASVPSDTLLRVEALGEARKTPGFESLATLFKRVKNITKDFQISVFTPQQKAVLKEPAEVALLTELEQRRAKIDDAVSKKRFVEAMNELAWLHAPVNRFFVDVLVMAEDPVLREARLALLATLRDTVLQTSGDISEIAPDEAKQA